MAAQLGIAVERGRVAAVAAGPQADPVQRVEVGLLIGPDGDPLGADWLGRHSGQPSAVPGSAGAPQVVFTPARAGTPAQLWQLLVRNFNDREDGGIQCSTHASKRPPHG